jgi:hypothetical protein
VLRFSIVPSFGSSFRTFSVTLLLALAGCGACTGDLSGPGGDREVPAGKIYASWHRPGGSQQPWVYDFSTMSWNRVPIWFDQASFPHVDTAGSVIVFNPPGTDLIVMSLDDSTQLETWPMTDPTLYQPLLSRDGKRVIATLNRPQSTEVRHFDRSTHREQVLGTVEDLSSGNPVHWFAHGDSVLLRGTYGFDWGYFVVALDGSAPRPFGFAPAVGAPYVAISRDDRRIAIGQPEDPTLPDGGGEETHFRIAVYDLERRVLLREFVLPHKVGDLAWSPGGEWLVHAPLTTFRDLTLEILDVETGSRRMIVPYTAGPEFAKALTWIR